MDILQNLKKVYYFNFPFNDVYDAKIYRSETFVDAMNIFLKTPNVTGLCVVLNSNCYAWIVFDDLKNNRWLVWNRRDKIACNYLSKKISSNNLFDGSTYTPCNIVPVINKIFLAAEVFTVDSSPSKRLIYGMILKDGTRLFFSYPVWGRKEADYTIGTIDKELNCVSSDSALVNRSIHFFVKLSSNRVVKVAMLKLSTFAALNDLWVDDQLVFAFFAAPKREEIRMVPGFLYKTWFWPTLIADSFKWREKVTFHSWVA